MLPGSQEGTDQREGVLKGAWSRGRRALWVAVRDLGLGGRIAEGMDEGTRPEGVQGDALRGGQAGVGRPGAVHGGHRTTGDTQDLARWPGRVGRNKGIMVAWGPLPTLGGRGRPAAYLGRCGPRLRCCPRRRSPDVPAPAALRPARPARRDPGPGPCSPRSPPSPPWVSISRRGGGQAERWASRHPHPPNPRGYLHPRGQGWVTGPTMCGPGATVVGVWGSSKLQKGELRMGCAWSRSD